MLPRAERIVLAAGPALVFGCAVAGTPRVQDAPAPRDFFAQVHDKEAACDHEVVVFRPGAPIAKSYKEVGSLSATCSPGAADICERRLRERACALGADGLVLVDPSAGPSPAGAPGQSLISRDGRAIRWER